MSAPGDSARGLWIGVACGVPVIAYGVIGLVADVGRDRALAVARWMVALLLVHDAFVVPAVLALVWLVHRLPVEGLHAPLVFALLASVLLTGLAAPGVLGLGNPSGNPTVHPFDTDAAWLQSLVAVWLVAGAWALVSSGQAARRARRSRPPC
jgi:hypothetical protein